MDKPSSTRSLSLLGTTLAVSATVMALSTPVMAANAPSSQAIGRTAASQVGHNSTALPLLAPAQFKPPVASNPPRLYHVKWGDTLWGLAQEFKVTVPELQQANDLGSSTAIYAGHYLIIPGEYTVRQGDTLRTIANAFHVPLVALWQFNRLSSDLLRAGQTLFIPYLGTVPAPAYTAPPAPVNPGQTTAATAYTANELLMLAHVIQAEAGNQPFLGMVAVGAVVLNRVRAAGFPKSIEAVIFQPGQFESVANGTYWKAPTPEAVKAAQAALQGWDPTQGSLYFYNPALTQNAWIKSLPVTVQIGQQVFCR